MSTIAPSAPASAPPSRTPPSSKRWHRDYHQWQRKYERLRPASERRCLPDALDDDVPKAWMTRALVHEEKAWEQQAAQEEDASDCAGEGQQTVESKVTQLLDEESQVVGAQREDMERRRQNDLSRRSYHQAERARFEAEIAAAPQKLARVAAEAAQATDAAKLREEVLAVITAQNDRVQPVRDEWSRACEFDEEEVTLLSMEWRSCDEAAVADKFRLELLDNLLIEKQHMCQQAELSADTARKLAWAQRQLSRWSRLCQALLARAFVELLAASQTELDEAIHDTDEAVLTWQQRCAMEEQGNEVKRNELTTLSDRAAELESQVEEVLADFLGLAWRRLSRASTPVGLV